MEWIRVEPTGDITLRASVLTSIWCGSTAFRKGRWQGLSSMQGNLHVPFLGGWAGAIPPGYPAGESNLASLSRPLCRRSKLEGIEASSYRSDSPIAKRFALNRLGDAQRLPQYLC